MKKAVFLLLTICSICNAQNKQIDSCLEVLKTDLADTNRISTLNYLARCFSRISDYEKAKKYATDALQISIKINRVSGIAKGYHNIGAICDNQGNYQDALKAYLKCIKISEENGYKRGIAFGHKGIAGVYFDQGNFAEAAKNAYTSLKAYEEINDKEGIITIRFNLVSIYRKEGKLDEVLKNYSDILKISQELGNKSFMIDCYNEMGTIYKEMDNLEEALKNYSAALRLAEETGSKQQMAYAYSGIGTIQSRQKNYTEALKLFLKSLKIAEEIRAQHEIISANRFIGGTYTKMKKFEDAHAHLYSALSLGKQIGHKGSIMSTYECLVELDSSTGNYKQLFEDLKMRDLYKDSLYNEASDKQTAEAKAKYESEKKEKEIALLSKDNEIQAIEIKKQKLLKYSLIGGLTLVILLVVFGYRYYRSRQVLRLQDIRNRIAGDLHDDIGSTLNSISVYSEVAMKNDSQREAALEMIGVSSRKIIDAMSDIVWTINPDNDSLPKIIFRMKSLAHHLLRAKDIEYTFHSDEAIDEKKLTLEDRRNFYLIFKEAINNLVKYSAATLVDISLTDENGQMKLHIRDNGAGFDLSQKNVGNGLKNMKRRADEMKAKFTIDSQKGTGTQIELILTA